MVPRTKRNRSAEDRQSGLFWISSAKCYASGMPLNTTVRRRWVGVLCLGGAVLMLAAGQTVLRDRLHDIAFLVYWMICFGFTGLAVAVALLDARANRRRLREERRDLLEATLKDIQSAAQGRRQAKGKQRGQ